MAGPWDIKIPPPIQPLNPVRPGDAIRDRKDNPRQATRERQRRPEREIPRDDEQPHIDDYA